MSIETLPPDVLEFLAAHVATLDDLAVLSAILDDESRWWDARMMATYTGLPASEARRILDGFAKRNLLDIRITGEVRYHLSPGTPALARGIDAVASAYRRAPTAIVRQIAHRARRSVMDFADAFRIKRR